MENESKAFTQDSPRMDAALSRTRLPRGDAAGRPAVTRWSVRQAEWAILRSSPINGLIVGAPHLTATAMALLEKSGRQPVVWWDPEQMSDIPEMIAGTLVIDDVEHLDKNQQERLSRWIGVHGSAVRVLALARAPLYDQVADGRFSAALYYRINTVTVEMRAPADMP
jgi:hypothetical protein